MSALRQAVFGLLAALLSSAVLIGSILLALVESGHKLAQALPPSPVASLSTPRPGEPTFTISPTPEPSSTPTVPVALLCPPPAGWIQVEALPGDTIPSIAQDYNISPEILRQANCDYPGNLIPSLTLLNVPAFTATPTTTSSATATPTPEPTNLPRPTRTTAQQAVCSGPPREWVVYIVQRGDTLYSIATSRGITVAAIKSANCLTSDTIRVGQRLWAPFVITRTSTPSATPQPSNTSVPPTATDPPTATPTSTPTHTATTDPSQTGSSSSLYPP